MKNTDVLAKKLAAVIAIGMALLVLAPTEAATHLRTTTVAQPATDGIMDDTNPWTRHRLQTLPRTDDRRQVADPSTVSA
ncbi:hypothetical protein ACIBJC_08590 [Streptomyces sp. NPDC050509]|uniref:hypothetical protein n=1 Tax=Streptomyces sp. NPDC050509 TaxID=3365620 RepID=UPI0037929528